MLGDVGGPNVEHFEEGDGTVLSTIDATSETDWVYLTLADGKQVVPEDPDDDTGWDLAFLRFHIKLNGGVSGPAGLTAAVLEDTVFDDLDVAPNDGYEADEADGDDDDEDPEYVLRDWYAYNVMTHVLTPQTVLYVIKTADGQHYKVSVDGYYDDAGSSGHLSFRWGTVDAP